MKSLNQDSTATLCDLGRQNQTAYLDNQNSHLFLISPTFETQVQQLDQPKVRL